MLNGGLFLDKKENIMNKKIKEYFIAKGLVIEKNQGYGVINNYEVNLNVEMLHQVCPVQLHFSMHVEDDKKEQIINDLNSLGFKRITFEFTPYGLFVGLNDITVSKLMGKMDDILNKIFEVLDKYEIKKNDYCPKCGEKLEDEVVVTSIGILNFKMHPACKAELVKEDEKEEKSYIEAPNNYAKGFLGALIGGIVGVVTFEIFISLNVISAISAFISVALGAFLYRKFGGKPNAVMPIMVSLVTLVFILGDLVFVYVRAADAYAQMEGSLVNGTGFSAFFDIMKGDYKLVEELTCKQFQSEFYSNLIVSIIFIILGAGYEVFIMFKNAKYQKSVK